jgi:hypothetical protein
MFVCKTRPGELKFLKIGEKHYDDFG